MTTKDHPGSQIRRLLAEPGILIVPGAYDALTARLIEDAGFPIVYATGAGISNSQLGLADVGLLSFGEIFQQVGRIVEATSSPVIVDADTGYGGPANVVRTVKEFARIGVGGIQLEDQVFPKQCGHFEGKSVVPAEEMVGKLHAALDAREDEELVVIARTDAREGLGLDAALERARAYAEAGADLTFVEAPLTKEEMARIRRVYERYHMILSAIVRGEVQGRDGRAALGRPFVRGFLWSEAYPRIPSLTQHHHQPHLAPLPASG